MLKKKKKEISCQLDSPSHIGGLFSLAHQATKVEVPSFLLQVGLHSHQQPFFFILFQPIQTTILPEQREKSFQ